MKLLFLILFIFYCNPIEPVQKDSNSIRVFSQNGNFYINQIKFFLHTNILTTIKVNLETAKNSNANILIKDSFYLILFSDTKLEYFLNNRIEFNVKKGKFYIYSESDYLLNSELIKKQNLILVNINEAKDESKKEINKKKIVLEEKKINQKVLKSIEKESLEKLKESLLKEEIPVQSNSELLKEINSLLENKVQKINKFYLKNKKLNQEKSKEVKNSNFYDEKEEINPKLKLELNQGFEK